MVDCMLVQFNVDDTVLVFGQYEGIIVEQTNDQVMIFCPEYNKSEPWLVTHIDNVVLIEPARTTLAS